MSATRHIARFVAETRLESVPEECVEIAKNQVIDFVGVTVAGSLEPSVSMALEFLREMGSRGRCTAIAQRSGLPPDAAAFVNGLQSHNVDFDDVNETLIGHPTTAVLPAVLAAAEAMEADGKQVLEAYILGVEVACKLGLLVNPREYEIGWHPTCTLGTLGAAMGAGIIYKLDQEQLLNALGLAASMAGGLRQNFGTMTKPFHAGRAAENGIRAALLARKGWTADRRIIEAPYGICSAFTGGLKPDFSNFEKKLGNPYDMVSPGIIVKKYPSCAFTHPTIDAVLALIRENNIHPDEVESAECGISKMASDVLIHSSAGNGLEGKFCAEFCVASALVDGNVGLKSFEDANVLRPSVQQEMPKIRRRILPPEEKVNNVFGPAIVQITLRNGRVLSKRIDIAKGDPRKPMSEKEVYDKYAECSSAVFRKQTIDKTYAMMQTLQKISDVRQLTTLLRRKGKE
jgi:2-methylcitrate dehydratase PrpD